MTTDDGREAQYDQADKYVVNSMRVAASQQVMLRVRFVEVDRTAERDLGVQLVRRQQRPDIRYQLGKYLRCARTRLEPSHASWSKWRCEREWRAGTPGGVPLFQTFATFVTGALNPVAAAPFGVGLFKLGSNVDAAHLGAWNRRASRAGSRSRIWLLSPAIRRVSLPAENIPCRPVQSSSGTAPVITTQYYPYGVQLTFVPTVLANGIINLRLNPSVSELDYKNAVVISGTAIPSITKREARTTIELRDGQSFAIAGLLQSDNAHDVNQVPWLGSVPVLGTLFSSKSYQLNETDLVVIVSPHLVAPAAPGQVLATPLDKEAPSNDIDFFLVGNPSVRKQYTDYVISGGGMQGPYGYIMPRAPAPN